MKPGTDNLFLIDLEQPVRGFRKFISSWVIVSDTAAVVIDPGPSATIPVLVHALEDLGIKDLSAVLLTHIHIDHAGGTGHLLDHFPGVPVLCHPSGFRHLTDPGRLWEGSVQVLGDLAHTYGPIKPVPEDLLFFDHAVSSAGYNFEVIETPGHARHHLSFLWNDVLFAGEALGTYIPGPGLYLRMATPPVFHYREFMDSIDRLSRLPVHTVCFAHYGLSNRPADIYATARSQLDLWVDIIKEATDPDKAVEKILAADPVLNGLTAFPPDIREREMYFLGNAVRGIASGVQQ